MKTWTWILVVGWLTVGCAKRDPHFALMGKSQGFLSTPANNKVDILWVIDNSGSMGPKQTNLANSVQSFMSKFITKKIDFQIAVVTTDIRPVDPLHPLDPNFSGQGACIVGTPLLITPTTPDPVHALAANANVGFFGAADAHGLDAVQLALSAPNLSSCNAGFLRSDAFLAVIEFSDSDDDTPSTSNELLSFLNTYKKPYVVSSMVVDDLSKAACQALGPFSETGLKFMDLATKTGGSIASICDSDFSSGLLSVSTKILEATTAVHLATAPDPTTIQVFQNGTPTTKDNNNGWSFDPSSNSIVFHGEAIPTGAGVNITVNYTPADIVR